MLQIALTLVSLLVWNTLSGGWHPEDTSQEGRAPLQECLTAACTSMWHTCPIYLECLSIPSKIELGRYIKTAKAGGKIHKFQFLICNIVAGVILKKSSKCISSFFLDSICRCHCVPLSSLRIHTQGIWDLGGQSWWDISLAERWISSWWGCVYSKPERMPF